MLKSSNDLTKQQSFFIKVKKAADGKFIASTPSYPHVTPVTASTEQMAGAKLGDELQRLHAQGKL